MVANESRDGVGAYRRNIILSKCTIFIIRMIRICKSIKS